MIICPICKEKLIKEGRTYRCSKNHSFDLSKSGHVNLLLDNQKHSKMPGDDKDMVLSRKHFLEKNYYKGISDKLNEIILRNIPENSDKKINILDIGCGEGYYTGNLKNFLDKNNIQSEIIGIDISKEAVISASKSHKGINWIVASATNIPVCDESLDFIICMFAKIIPEEKMRTLKKGGKLIIVSTGENHLLQMKEVVYENVRKDFYSPIEDLKIFKYLETINCTYKTFIRENESIKNLFNMTPYRWRSPREGIERLFSLNELETFVDVNFDIFTK
ncbi:methyltransferase domain-containing protein [Fusobacterium perfoetens]|uniref:putative RNA methyltransferase n=1 Tax=Fusobacterium perfoetens TaxID=852 RepID=UPI001F345E07|nr:methyltransferase domain-containing protein [Fusobacterium perfoetens]MCF2625329.1 methyltransferase domain-containing protein [Fusobacterium perfoetens]